MFRFGFEGWLWVLIASVPDLCIRFTHNIFCDFAGPILIWICLSENRKEKACSTSRFQAILFLVTHEPKINTEFIDQLSITRHYGNCIPTETKNLLPSKCIIFHLSANTHLIQCICQVTHGIRFCSFKMHYFHYCVLTPSKLSQIDKFSDTLKILSLYVGFFEHGYESLVGY